jgi:hypothetical protein
MNPEDVPPVAPAAVVRKKRKWWFYALIVLGALAVVAAALFIGALIYWKSLITTYAANQPKPLPKFEISAVMRQELTQRWTNFQKMVEADQPIEPFRLSAEDLNVALANWRGVGERFRFMISGDQLQGEFSVPLDKTRQGKLKGKYLNGTITFALSLGGDGFPILRAAKAEVNGKPAPRLIFGRLQKRNLLEDLGRNREFAALLQNVDNIEVKDNYVVITPHRLAEPRQN